MDRVFRVDLYPHEFLSLTAHMTVEQRGLFITVCCLIYAHRGAIKDDGAWIGRMANCSPRMCRGLLGQLFEQGDIQIHDGFIHQKRSESELAKKRTHLELSAKGGSTSAESKRKKRNNNDITSTDDKISVGSSSPSPPRKQEDLLSGGKPPSSSPKRIPIIFDFASNKFEGVTDQQIAIWAEAYPAIDIVTELKKMRAWLIANPKNRKKDYPRFINQWLAKSQDRAPAGGSNERAHNGGNHPQHPITRGGETSAGRGGSNNGQAWLAEGQRLSEKYAKQDAERQAAAKAKPE